MGEPGEGITGAGAGPNETAIRVVKQHRKDLDDVLQRIRASGPSREVSLGVTKVHCPNSAQHREKA